MGTISVGYDNFGFPWIEVTAGGGTPYNEIQQAIGQGYQYGLNGLYMKTLTQSQLFQIVTLLKNNRRGIFESKAFVPVIDPYQFISALTSEVIDQQQGEQLTFNGLQNFVLPIESQENVIIVFSVQEQGANNLIPSPTNFERLEFYDFLADFPQREADGYTDRTLLIPLVVKNNSSNSTIAFTGKVSLLGGAADTFRQSANANGLWQWAFNNNEPFNITQVDLLYKNVADPTFSVQSIFGSFTTAQEIADAFSIRTGLGLFWVSYNVLNQPILMTTNDSLNFSTLTYTGTL